MSGTTIDKLPPNLGKLQNLTTYIHQSCNLTEVPPQILSLKNIRVLDLAGKCLSLLIWKNTKVLYGYQSYHNAYHGLLLELRAQCLNYEIIPQRKIDTPNTINFLQNTVNKISTLPVDLDKLSNLERLDLSNNRLTKLEPPLAALSNLRALILHNNPLST